MTTTPTPLATTTRCELLSQLKSETEDFSEGLADVDIANIPTPAKEKWEDVKISAAAMAIAATACSMAWSTRPGRSSV